jgi:N-acetylneuraminic acid mutarotase
MKINLSRFKIGLLGLASFSLACAGQAGVWSSRAPLPSARSGAAAAAVNDTLYYAGGHNGTDTPTLQAYHPATDSWSSLAAMPGGRYQGNGAGVISNNVYIAGGWSTSPGLPNNNFWVYDTVANSWSARAGLPTLSACGASGVIGNTLYVTTACDGNSGYRNFLHRYDPSSDSWTSRASSIHAHSNPAFGVIGGRLYLAGGNDENGV